MGGDSSPLDSLWPIWTSLRLPDKDSPSGTESLEQNLHFHGVYLKQTERTDKEDEGPTSNAKEVAAANV